MRYPWSWFWFEVVEFVKAHTKHKPHKPHHHHKPHHKKLKYVTLTLTACH